MKYLLDYIVFLSLMFITIGYATAGLTDDLVVYFTFDNVEGNRVVDESGNALDATIIENTQFVKGKYGDAVQITHETEDCLNIPTADELEISEEITMMAWVYHEDWTRSSSQWFDKGSHSQRPESYGMTVFDERDVPALKGFFKNGSGITIILGGGGAEQRQMIVENTMENRTWHHIVGICEANSVKMYLDGEMLFEDEHFFNFTGINDEDLRIGCAKGKPEYAFEDGSIDEVAIWRRALNEDEIQTAMRGPLFPVSPKDKITTTWGDIKREAF